MLPSGHKAGQHVLFYRFNFFAQRGQGTAPQHPQHVVVAPLPLNPIRPKLALDHPALPFQFFQPADGPLRLQAQCSRQLIGEERAVSSGVPGHQICQRILNRIGECRWQTRRERDPQGISEPRRVFGRRNSY